MALTTVDLDPADELRRTLDRQNSVLRLHELRQAYDGRYFDTATVRLVENGEIALIPVGEYVHVRRKN